jgi:hypothetical protein
MEMNICWTTGIRFPSDEGYIFFGITPKPSLFLPTTNLGSFIWYKTAEIQTNYLYQSSAD